MPSEEGCLRPSIEPAAGREGGTYQVSYVNPRGEGTIPTIPGYANRTNATGATEKIRRHGIVGECIETVHTSDM